MEKENFFTTKGTGMPNSWNPIFGMESQTNDHNCTSQQPPSCYFTPNWSNLVEQSDPFESALSSIVSSPANSHSGIPIPGNESIVLRELIGRLGSICNSGEISPQSYINSTTNSCYNTPLNSPPKLNLSITNHQIAGSQQFQAQSFPINLQRSARLSSLEGVKGSELCDAMEESSVSEQNVLSTNSNVKKRKAIPKGKGKETQFSIFSAKDDKESDAKRSKSNEEGNIMEKELAEENDNGKKTKENAKAAEPPKDYIHVRARRGQATDSHSLAERVRREKISERMKFLQDLVPGCNKVTGKAVMLDEIINYVQSLQRQVEFLSMKLATVNPRMDATMEALLSKDVFRASVPNNTNPLDTLAQPFSYGFQSQQNGMVSDALENHYPLMMPIHRNSNIKSSHIDSFDEASTFWENDLQSVVQMGLGQNQPQGFHGTMVSGQMKVEL